MSFEKSVKGGTKVKLAPPKAKYIEHVLVATHAGESGVAEVFRALQNRLRDSTWTIVFKSLIMVHLMIREGEANVTLGYVAEHPSRLAISNFSDVQIQGTNIRHYYNYLLSRAKSYRDTQVDWVREGTGRLKKQSIDKGLLRETEAVQYQINALLKCELLNADGENEITICAFRLLTMDLLILYAVMNEGTINILEHYFEMSNHDAQRALKIYKSFTKQTDQVVEFLGVARHYENATRLEIPKLKHAPTSLTSSLQEYLNDPDFETNRRQYLAHKSSKKGAQTSSGTKASGPVTFKSKVASPPTVAKPSGVARNYQQGPNTKVPTATVAAKMPANDLIDFFGSIEQNQQSMAIPNQQHGISNGPFTTASQPGFQYSNAYQSSASGFPNQQATGNSFGSSNPFGQVTSNISMPNSNTSVSQPTQPFIAQMTNPYQMIPQPQPQTGFDLQPQTTGVTNGLTPPVQQPLFTGMLQPQTTNPFRQSMYPQATGASQPAYTFPQSNLAMQPQPTGNPFTTNGSIPSGSTASTFVPQLTNQTPSFSPPQPFQSTGTPFASLPPMPEAFNPQQQFVQTQKTGTNPFAKATPPPVAFQNTTLTPTATGSTNPFRQSAFVNQQTGQGWQAGQGTMAGLEQLPTIPVFPRPGAPAFS